ncbi:MAG: TIGR04283 family arsenosugar biosynthesis glycosyltransferase [Gemmataceae bacterium]
MSISIIIPVLDEADHIRETIRALRARGAAEIVVVDGGSSDATLSAAAEADVVARAPRGRAAQMNHGAAHASGDILLFLHADCQLEEGALRAAEQLLCRQRVVAGCFTMRVRAEGGLYRAIDYCATARVRLTGIVYGDQGLFLRRALFERLGGFPPLRFLEDLYFSRELRRQGRIAVASQRIFVSPRRWQRQGLIQQTLRNWTLTALAAAGAPPDYLARFYPAVR